MPGTDPLNNPGGFTLEELIQLCVAEFLWNLDTVAQANGLTPVERIRLIRRVGRGIRDTAVNGPDDDSDDGDDDHMRLTDGGDAA